MDKTYKFKNIDSETNSSEVSKSTSDNRLSSDLNSSLVKESTIYLKSISNVTTKVSLCLEKPISELISIIMRDLNASSQTHDLKLIYSGKILNFTNSLHSYGIEEDHVILYMLKEKEGINQNNNEVQNAEANISNQLENNLNNIENRGFGTLANFGATEREIGTMRLMFHLSYIQGRGLDASDRELWRAEAVIAREEEWMNQLNNSEDSNRMSISSMNLLLQRRMRLINNLSSNRDSILNVDSDGMYQYQHESNFSFLCGFLMGLCLSWFVLLMVR